MGGIFCTAFKLCCLLSLAVISAAGFFPRGRASFLIFNATVRNIILGTFSVLFEMAKTRKKLHHIFWKGYTLGYLKMVKWKCFIPIKRNEFTKPLILWLDNSKVILVPPNTKDSFFSTRFVLLNCVLCRSKVLQTSRWSCLIILATCILGHFDIPLSCGCSITPD